MELQDLIRRAIEVGHRRGFVTFDQINELIPSHKTAPEDIEALMALMTALSAEEIQIVDE
jgi:RNA polymerase primary sigma factor